ncbi:hypothetical protein [Acidiferrobacter thiooxydans]|uniref:Uncharacterized protein n=1 Tax=Acidiferrobacter thiooxydans TaxID=163359 RepID=A0A1C2G3N4_9GAMM|nr:hypothetical protein [Acidiferrobacter thiooxydans]RCN59035.1 hypothetical protein C4900_04645 [Acidiferrobacter thiooxydans]UEO00784.1 hypothetical protein A9R16_005105 [Acidiferrobacter thiooxydans]
MQLNDEQAKHIADTLRIASVAEFGFFGYTGGLERHDWLLVFLAVTIFVLIESGAVLIMRERA